MARRGGAQEHAVRGDAVGRGELQGDLIAGGPRQVAVEHDAAHCAGERHGAGERALVGYTMGASPVALCSAASGPALTFKQIYQRSDYDRQH